MMRLLTLLAVLLSGLVLVASTVHPTRCTEDMHCWNCHTMGNRICGKATP